MLAIEERLKEAAREVGFCLVGIAAATPADGLDRYMKWLDAGYHGEMDYLRKKADARRDPAWLLPGVRSVVMVGIEDGCGRTDESEDLILPPSPGFAGEGGTFNMGKIARFARGTDYHQVIWRKLDYLHAWLKREIPGCRTRGVADSAPLLERDFARRAGLGWIGKNTMLINKHRGSFILLGGVLIDAELQPDPAHEAMHCGTCTACLTACPTDAFPAPGVLDARKCISYLNIEVKGPIPLPMREGVGDWIYGCDICQDVCPWNRKATGGAETIDAIALLMMDQDEFKRRFTGTTMYRIHRRGLARNAAIVLGNSGDASALPALRAALGDIDEAVREAAAWAIERILRCTASPVA